MTVRFVQRRLPAALDAYRDSTGIKARRAIVEELTRGLRRGDNPEAVARRIRRRIRSIATGRAMTIARTELMTAQWEATARDFQRDRAVVEWQWMATGDGRTCIVCRAMHGRRFPKAERLASHPNCRCAMSPVLPGFEAIPPDQTGEAAFRRLPAREKRRILGDARYAAYRRLGSLGAMTTRTRHPVFGPGRAVAPLRSLRESTAA